MLTPQERSSARRHKSGSSRTFDYCRALVHQVERESTGESSFNECFMAVHAYGETQIATGQKVCAEFAEENSRIVLRSEFGELLSPSRSGRLRADLAGGGTPGQLQRRSRAGNQIVYFFFPAQTFLGRLMLTTVDKGVLGELFSSSGKYHGVRLVVANYDLPDKDVRIGT